MANGDSDIQSVRRVYAERFAADLTANRSEQEEITARIGELRTRLEQLKEDESWLAGMQGTLPAGAPAPQSVPQPRPARGPDAKAPQAKAAGKRAVAAKGAAGKAQKKAAALETAPLHQLVLALLPAGEPRLVREVHADLEEAHPERKTSVQVVRNTLETLVKRSAIGKGTQKGAAMYTAPERAAEPVGGMASAGA